MFFSLPVLYLVEMSLFYFDQITKEHSYLGGKGYSLGLMKNAGFPVPDGLILTEKPTGADEWNAIFVWWNKNGNPNLAIRSSAVGEDSSEQSFAGQNSTYLNVKSESGIKSSVEKCFQSMFKKSSSLYREHFLKEKASEAKMNVVLQIMVEAKYSGVFFSVDPRNNEQRWVAEAILGYGEDLVSGKKTPLHFEEKKLETTDLFNLQELVKTGNAIRDFFGFEIDMEWATDQQNNLLVLQARPITALSGKSEEKRLISEELARLKKNYSKDTLWDGGTFAEWSGPPSELTFSIWKKAFSKDQAFSSALKKLGYLGIDEEINNETHSLLEKIFDRGYVNISMLAPLYFGPIPYHLVNTSKGPKLKFDFHKMTFITFIKTPFTLWRMIQVSFQLSTQRSKWLNECTTELSSFTNKAFRISDLQHYESFSNQELSVQFKMECEQFYNQHLVWPLVLVSLIQSTSESLKGLLKNVIADDEIERKLNEWLGNGLHSVTMDMNNDYVIASQNPAQRKKFLQQYGHRGPGELELSNPRWMELGEKTFINLGLKKSGVHTDKNNSVEDDIQKLKSYKKQVISKEWALLKQMLELREKWKMHLLSPYSHIRYLALEIAKRNQLGSLIFWFSMDEILEQKFDLKLALTRKNHSELSKSIYLPSIIDLDNLENVLSNKIDTNLKIISGEALSPGLVYGEVRVVSEPDSVDTQNWPENTILVAESTDPGWTGLFLKSRAIIVEKGGVLSHCAIVAREMGLPAVSGIKQCHLRFKDGDKIWVDGNNGRITLA